MTFDLTHLLVYSLACFRLALLLSEDTGPAKMFQRLRSLVKREARQHPSLRKTDLHHGIECLRCSSVWMAAPVAAYACWRDNAAACLRIGGDLFIIWMALSAMAVLWNRAFPKR